MELKIAPSILSADFGDLNREIAEVEPYSDLIHVDVMDGHFVSNITIGPTVVKWIKSSKPLDVHLMIENPEDYIDDFAKAGASSLTVHAEASDDLPTLVRAVKALGVKAAVSIRPKTAVHALREVIDLLDMVLVMTVEPGFAGQEFMEDMMSKVKEIRETRADLDIQVDGGINEETAKVAVAAGANVLVAGSYIFKSENRIKAIESLREASK